MYKIPDVYGGVICITDDPVLGAIVSSYFNDPGVYFCLIEAPRLKRPDSSNELIRRTNLMARLQPEVIILAGVEDDVVSGFLKNVPIRKLVRVNTPDETYELMESDFGAEKTDVIQCRTNDVIEALIVAKAHNNRIQINNEAHKIDLSQYKLPKSKHKLVIDDYRGISPIVSINYAHSIRAEVVFFPSVDEEEVEEIYDDISTASYYRKTKRGTNASRNLDSQESSLSALAKDNSLLTDTELITFVTKGIPYGYFYPDTPATHLFSYPDLGITIFNN